MVEKTLTRKKYDTSWTHEKNLDIYDVPAVAMKWNVLPDYVKEAALNNPARDRDPRYDEIVLSKWGRREVDTNLYDETPEMVFYRAARLAAHGLVNNDPSLDLEERTHYVFDKFMNREMFPNTPYMANAGHADVAKHYRDGLVKIAGDYPPQDVAHVLDDLKQEEKQRAQLFACFVLGVYDDRASIFDTMGRAAAIQAGTGGTGFNFSNLRPANEAVVGTGGVTDGPVSFMSAYSTVLGKTMNQGGKREGANMFMQDFNHPDIMRFIYSKRKDGEIPAANISVAVDHTFMEACKATTDEAAFFPLINPHYDTKKRPQVTRHYTVDQLKKAIATQRTNKKTKLSLLLGEDQTTVLSPFLPEGMAEEDRAIGKVGDGGTIYLDARKVLKHLAYGAWFNGEPGVIHLGYINDGNPTHPRHFFKALEEQGKLKEYLGEKGADGESLERVVELSIRTPDFLPPGIGVITATNPCGEKPLLPNEACVLGHVSLERLLDKQADGNYIINKERLKENTALMTAILDNAIDQNTFTDEKIAVTQKSNRKIGLGFMGLANMLFQLEIPYNSQEGRDALERVYGEMEEVSDQVSIERAKQFGTFPNFPFSSLRNGPPIRNAIRRTLAPTGTTAFVAQTTGGCEPEYALRYTRTTVQGTQIKLTNPILTEKIAKYPIFLSGNEKTEFEDYIDNAGRGSIQGFTLKRGERESEDTFIKRSRNLDALKRIFVTAHDISPEDHLRMQAAVQAHTDDAISKTTNFRANATPSDVEAAYILAHDLKIKGTTFYRDGSRRDQPLEVKGTKASLIDNGVDYNLLINMIQRRLETARPDLILGATEKMVTPFGKGFLTYNAEMKDGRSKPYEVFINIGKGANDVNATMEGYARLMSAALRAGVPPEYLIDQLKGIGGRTEAVTNEGRVRSLPDAFATTLEKLMEKLDKQQLGITHPNGKTPQKQEMSGNFCEKCGGPLTKRESCEVCIPCGTSIC